MRQTVRSLFDSSIALSPSRPHAKNSNDASLANLSPKGPPKQVQPVMAEADEGASQGVVEVEKEVVLEVVATPEEKSVSDFDAQAMMDLMLKHQEEVAKLQAELRRVDVERSRAETEAQAATGTLAQTERRLDSVESELRDERTRYDVAMQRAQLMEQAHSLPWWRWSLRKEMVRRAQALTKALPAR